MKATPAGSAANCGGCQTWTGAVVLQPASKIQHAHTPNQAPRDTQGEGQRRSMGIAEPSMQ
ncbi:MAG: hypothetical protein NXI28_10975 [bacterium]|nr:hypothetical protein [bacterium]